ncbi:hypothetical protein MUN89_11615 [Halobacillus salinarum]|uniref:Uncharacterized protein n=1 Tax=Halobacillus salinarum TaxID=2932257 RepID=A0ABY4EDU0_9BACI|nr:hypothetical protein [Halobacillus salinarum]UOQ42625.1 hypothetical protein MUN89_11615 [Halobacillus salinarum]
MNLIITILLFFLLVYFIAGLLGYKKGTIIIDLDEKYLVFNQNYVNAIIEELSKQGKTAVYIDYRRFSIDGRDYIAHELHWGFLQRTLLKPDRTKKNRP